MKKILLPLVLIFMALPAGAENITEVTMMTTLWETFSYEDGTGLYNEIIDAVYGLYDIPVIHKYVPGKRGILEVKKGIADVYACHYSAEDSLLLAKHPMYEGTFHVFFKKDTVETWERQNTLTGKKVVCVRGYYDEHDLDVPIQLNQVSSGVSALSMVLKNRADFYLDDINLINESIKNCPLQFDMNDYLIKEVGFRSYHPVFKDSERGKILMELYDKGMEQLYRSGELKKIFEKWGYLLPSYYVRSY